MFSSFKNTELFRYFIRVDLTRNIDKIIKKNNANFTMIIGSIFSGSFSVLGTYFGMHGEKYGTIKTIFISVLIYSILFIIAFGIFQIVIYIKRIIWNVFKPENKRSGENIKAIIDDFDHIACDNILISQAFIESYNNQEISNKLKEFYFYEIIYYTSVSLQKIKSVIANEDKCISTSSDHDKIHLYRLENILSMMSEICAFLNSNKVNIDIDTAMKTSLSYDIRKLETDIEMQMRYCAKIKEKYVAKK